MNKSEFRSLIQGEIRRVLKESKTTNSRRKVKRLTEASTPKAATLDAVLKLLDKEVKSVLASEGVEVNKLKPAEIRTIGTEWLLSTITSGYVDETLPQDMFENEIVAKIVEPYIDDSDSGMAKRFAK